jgi:DNA-binding SARP family transcriptional activator
MNHDSVAAVERQTPYMLHLFSGPYVTRGRQRLDVPEGSKRLVAFVAIHETPVERRYAAGTLWPLGDDTRAAGNLRSAIWRLKSAGAAILISDKHTIRLRDDVAVDANILTAWARRLVRGDATSDDLDLLPSGAAVQDLRPGWYDDWATTERERTRQLLLHAVEALSRKLAAVGRCAEAIEAAMMVVHAEPLRETAQQVLMDALLAEGNWSEAQRCYEHYRVMLDRELGERSAVSLETHGGAAATREGSLLRLRSPAQAKTRYGKRRNGTLPLA